MARVRKDNQSHFAQVPKVEIQRSKFDRSHGLKTTFDSGFLIPIYVDEALPGDTFSFSMSGFARLATPIKPIMDNLYLDTFFFAVPNRLLWSNWKKFNGEQQNPGASTDYVVPVVNFDGTETGNLRNLIDYMGIPPGVPCSVSALPFRAMNLIFNEWFRDQNLRNSVAQNVNDGPDTALNYGLYARGKRHDYFTSCLPWPQKGEGVSAQGPVTGIMKDTSNFDLTNVDGFETGTLGTTITYPYAAYASNEPLVADDVWYFRGSAATSGYPEIYADIDINNLRQAFQVQRLLERDARGGTRYTEIVRSHFGVISPDARLQRPEYLGGGTTRINISPVAQTQRTDEGTGTPQGNLSAVGTAAWNGHSWTKSFTEHCTLIGFCSVRADLTYQDGLDRMWSRRTRFDFYWPALAHIGEQSVLNSEIYLQGTPEDDEVFGYQERYAEYRYKPSRISGKFRSSDAESLDVWHLAQEFASLPTLSQAFIEDKPPVARVVAVQDEPEFLMDAWFKLKCARPMPVYGVPGMIDHF